MSVEKVAIVTAGGRSALLPEADVTLPLVPIQKLRVTRAC